MDKIKFTIVLLPLITLLTNCNGKTKTPINTYKITFECQDCAIYDENDTQIDNSITIDVVESQHTFYQKFYFKDYQSFKRPLESYISVKNTDTGDLLNFEYEPLTGEIILPISSNLTVEAKGFAKTLEECSWTEIEEISLSGCASYFFALGDEKSVTLLENGEPQEFAHKVRIIGYDCDYTDPNHPDDSKVGITFEFANVITKKEGQIKTKWDENNSYNFFASNLYKTIYGDPKNKSADEGVVGMIPEDLKRLMKPVSKIVPINEREKMGEEYFIPTPYSALLFPLSHDELVNQYQFFAEHEGDDSYRIKTPANSETPVAYWTRSPLTTTDNSAAEVSEHGDIMYTRASSPEYGVAPAFCI